MADNKEEQFKQKHLKLFKLAKENNVQKWYEEFYSQDMFSFLDDKSDYCKEKMEKINRIFNGWKMAYLTTN